MLSRNQLVIPLALVIFLSGAGGAPGTIVWGATDSVGSQGTPDLIGSPSPANASVEANAASASHAGRAPIDIRIDNQTTDGTSVTIDSVTLPEGGVVVIQSNDGGTPSGLLGLASGVPPGTTEDLTITLDRSIDETQTVWAIAESGDEDALDRATVTIEDETRPVAVNVTPRAVQTGRNGTFTVDVGIDTKGQPVYGAQVMLTFNATLLDVASVKNGTFFGGDGADTLVVSKQVNQENGTVDYGETRTGDTGIVGAGTLVSVTFRVTDRGVANVTTALALADVVVSDANATPVNTTVTNGTVDIAPTRPPAVTARLVSTVNNVGSPLVVEANASDSDGEVSNVTLRGPSDTPLVSERCNANACLLRLNHTPTTSTWNGSVEGYRLITLSVVATDDQGVNHRATVETTVQIAGDATGDGVVDIFDAVLVGRHWHEDRSDPSYSDGADLDNDGTVDILDAVILGRHWRDKAT